MKLAKGADVYTRDGEKVGNLDRVVLDPDTNAVTHVVVEKGFLFTTDRVIPIESIDAYGDEGITLNGTQEDFDNFPVFEEAEYVTLDEMDHPNIDSERVAGAAYWYPPTSLAWWRTGGGYAGFYPPMPTYVMRTEQNIPENTVALDEGARVVSKDDNHVGNIEEVIVEPEDNRVTHFVVKEGMLFSEKKLVPVTWISGITEDQVRLSVNSSVLERLPAYNVYPR